jgi:polysaccharide biosynthesis PFTS motif protein
LRSLSVPGKIHVVGPILWYLPELVNVVDKSMDEVLIVAFDVTPVTDKFAEEIGFFGNYYSTENMQAFLHGIEHAKNVLENILERRVKVKLKHKRGYAAIHDPAYIALVEHLQSSGSIELVSHNENLYSLIESADMVVVVPYSSPALVADALGIPAVFFDPTGEVLPIFDSSEHIYFAAGKDALVQVICEHINLTKAISP